MKLPDVDIMFFYHVAYDMIREEHFDVRTLGRVVDEVFDRDRSPLVFEMLAEATLDDRFLPFSTLVRLLLHLLSDSHFEL